jgi:hypothetical protein
MNTTLAAPQPIDPVELFKSRLLKAQPGESTIYHRGFLAPDRENRPGLHMVGMLAYGLHLLGRVELTQKRIMAGIYEYRARVLRPVRNVDFDHGRKTYLKSLVEES